MGGLAKICKMYGGMVVSRNGKTVEWYYDHVKETHRIRSEMTHEEWCASERIRWEEAASAQAPRSGEIKE